MSGRASFRVNRRAIEHHLATDPGARAHLRRAARAVADRANQLAPGDQAGNYRSTDDTVEATDPFWHLVEFGSVNNQAAAPMRRAAMSVLPKYTPE